MAWYCRVSASGVGTPTSRQNSSSLTISIWAGGPAFSSSARFSLLLFSRTSRLSRADGVERTSARPAEAPAEGGRPRPDDVDGSGLDAGPKPSDPTTSIVVFALTSSAVSPPRRATSARASLRPSRLSFPVKTTSCPASGWEAGRSGEGEGKRPLGKKQLSAISRQLSAGYQR